MVSRFDFNNEANDKRKGVGNKQKEQPSKKNSKIVSLAKGKKEKDFHLYNYSSSSCSDRRVCICYLCLSFKG